jgi:hypothetical protein
MESVGIIILQLLKEMESLGLLATERMETLGLLTTKRNGERRVTNK